MSGFSHRDRRLAAVEAAVAALDPRIAELKTKLEGPLPPIERRMMATQLLRLQPAAGLLRKEHLTLSVDAFETGDIFAEALGGERLWRDGGGILAMMRGDPVYDVAGQPLRLTDAMAAAIDALPRDGGRAREGFFAEAAGRIGDADAAEQAVGSVLGDWLRGDPGTRRSPFAEVGVMLPLRLETIFDDNAGAWTMSLRVVPDEVSIRRDRLSVTPTEKEFLDLFWAASAMMGPPTGTDPSAWLEHADGIAAWEQLAARVTPWRAAWLVTTFPAAVDGGAFVAAVGDDRIGGRGADQIFGLPKALKVTVVTTAGDSVDLGDGLHPDLAGETFGLPAGDTAFDNWLLSWERAVAVGMGGVFGLPPGVGPKEIAALYVYGVGDDDPAALFGAHVASGSLAMVRLGAPTNTVHGAPAADLATDAETWRRIAGQRMTGEAGAGIALLSMALCGDDEALPLLPGASHDMDDARLMVSALWPALWGHYARDLLNDPDEAMRLWFWCIDALRPEGPLPPIRVDTQPYGVLPVTALDRFQTIDLDDLKSTEQRIVNGLAQLIPHYVAAAEKRGNTVGANTGGLLDLLARPGVSSRYAFRTYVPAQLQASAYPGVAQADFMNVVEALWAPANDVAAKMERLYLAQGHPRDLRLPLIGSDRLLPIDIGLVDMVKQLYDMRTEVFASSFYEKFLSGLVPKSLLVRLMIHSALLAKAWAVQVPPTPATPVINAMRWTDPNTQTDLERLQMFFPDRPGSDELAEKLMGVGQEAIFRLAAELQQHVEKGEDPLRKGEAVSQLKLPPERMAQLERAMRATLDCAGYRIDPFATGLAWRRLNVATGTGHSLHRLGAYGWLDGPFMGEPGPTGAKRLHAPSHAQAITSIVLRDKQLSSAGEATAAGENVWEVNLSSSGVRLALAMADEVRLGFHIYEVVGRRVESIVGEKEKVRELRRLMPLRPHAADERDSCHGIDALDALLSPAGLPTIPVDAARKTALLAIRAGLETLGDLLTAEGVYQVVGGHADRAADAMDAAAGFARPPEFDVVRTPPSGYRLATSVLGVFRHRSAGDDASPLELADASLASFIADRFGEADWSWRFVHGAPAVTLADLGILPVEAALMGEDFLAQAVRSNAAGAGDIEPPVAHRLARSMTSLLGSAPAVLSDIAKDPAVDDVVARASETAVQAELSARYAATATALASLVDALDAGAPDTAGRIALLRGAIRWGYVGPGGSNPPTLLTDIVFGARVPVDEELNALLMAAAQALKARLPDDPAAEAALPIAPLTRAIGELVAPGGRLTVTARWPVQALRTAAALGDAADPALEDEWLAVTAAVRPALARLEALQLEARHLNHAQPLDVWSNAANDPWRRQLVDDNAALREAGQLTKIRLDRLVAAVGGAGALDGEDVAVALIDQFSEAVPMPQRGTFAAFGFNAPAARPPQAILLAVPSAPDRRLEAEEVLQILRETRDLLRVRAVLPEDAAHPALPSAWLEASSPMRVRLDSGSQFRR